jgi:tetratricopeptide (TPR) repeat protein
MRCVSRAFCGLALLVAVQVQAQFNADIARCADAGFMGLDVAIQYCDRVIESGKVTGQELFDAYYNRAVSLSRKNEVWRALKDLDEAIRIHGDEAYPFKARASLKLSRKDYQGARADLDEALRIDPKFAEAVALRGSTWLALGDLDREIVDFGRTLEMVPTMDVASLSGVPETRESAAVASAGLAPRQRRQKTYDRTGMDAMAYLGRSAARLQKGDQEGAEADLEQWVRLMPNYAATRYSARGALWLSIDNFELAIGDFSRSISSNPRDYSSLGSRGVAHLLKGEFAAAVKDFSSVIEANQRQFSATRLRGYSRFFAGDYPSATADLEQALRLNPAHPYVMLWLFLAKARSGEDVQKLKADLGSQALQMKRRRWPYPIIALLIGDLKPEDVVSAA